jgi:hypothetical protein
VLQLLIARAVAGPRPMTLFMRSYPARVACGLMLLWIIYALMPPPPSVPGAAAEQPSSAVLGVYFVVSNVHSLVLALMFISQVRSEEGFRVRPAAPPLTAAAPLTLLCRLPPLPSQISFFNRVSDPRMGGTFMTLLNTLSNLGA